MRKLPTTLLVLDAAHLIAFRNLISNIEMRKTGLRNVGPGGTILTSPDGIRWTPQSSGSSTNILSVAGSGSQFVAVGPGGTILSSP